MTTQTRPLAELLEDRQYVRFVDHQARWDILKSVGQFAAMRKYSEIYVKPLIQDKRSSESKYAEVWGYNLGDENATRIY